ncbi:MAG TPA: TonB-dependent receptor plug domain-containing protein, partial [Vicinamibacterales bacterium]|nr:TonB-dependent receptor plug domain-containing protein [Vicinamibacterales bacterium]
ATPGGRDIWNLIEYKAPGVVVESPDVGGNQGGLQRSMSSRGTPNAQNTQMLNGVNVNDPAAQGFAMNYYVPTTLENVEISTGAQDISVGTGGILINMVTKSGTNRLQGAALQTYQSKNTQTDNISDELKAAGIRPNANATDLITNSNFQVGGPLLRNKLFYFGSVNYQATHVSVVGFPAVVPYSFVPRPLANTSEQDTTDILAGEGKITYQLNSANRFEGYLSKQRYDKPNRGANNQTTQESNSKELDTFVITQLSYNRVLTNSMFFDGKVSYNNTHFPLLQKTDLQPLRDNTSNVLYRNRESSARMFRRRAQVVANMHYYVPEFLGGRHEFKVGFDNGYTPEDVDTTRMDDVNLTLVSTGGVPRANTVQIFNSPLHVERAVMTTAFYGQDAYSIGRLTLFGGVRWERIEGYLPEQSTPASQYFPEGLVFSGVNINGVVQNYIVRKSFPAVRNNPLWKNVAPRVSATYDLTGNGKTVLKASWGDYLDQINTGTPPNANANINQVYAWNDVNGDFLFQRGNATWNGLSYVGGEFGALQQTNNLAVATFDRSVRRPRRHEMSVSLDRELLPNLLVNVAYFRTREKDARGDVDQNMELWPSLFTPITLTDPGRDGVLNTADDAPITVYNQNQTGAVTSPRNINHDLLARRYDGFDVTATRRYSNGWQLLAGYTYSTTKVDATSLANPNTAFVNAAGEDGGRRHNFKASGSYDLPYGILFGFGFRLNSGLPITRTWQVPSCSATVTSNCVRQASFTLNAEPRGSQLLGWLHTLDLRGGRRFRLGGQELELSMDVYNATNANTTWDVRRTTSLTAIRPAGNPTAPIVQIPSFLSPISVLSPRVVRFNIQYRFGGGDALGRLIE